MPFYIFLLLLFSAVLFNAFFAKICEYLHFFVKKLENIFV